jgi:hypothetical protein
MKYKLHSLDEVLQFAKQHNIDPKESGYNTISFCKSMFIDECKDGKVLEQGFFYVEDKEDARYLAGPFFHHFGFVRLSVANDIDKLKTIAEMIKYNYDHSMELSLQYKDKYNYPIILDFHLVEPTKEKPYTVYLCGNDDFSWTKTFNTKEDAKEAIFNLCDKSEHKDYGGFQSILNDKLFEFTN